ncbi:hypothetical protein TNCV_2430051 [Trichonephila clavipes]|nr:hypothetical protein TNCV_2430051 [Trichonephila clavipes]
MIVIIKGRYITRVDQAMDVLQADHSAVNDIEWLSSEYSPCPVRAFTLQTYGHWEKLLSPFTGPEVYEM